MNIGLVITQLRKKKGISRNKLAKIAGISQTALYYIETNKNEGKNFTLSCLANALGIDYAVLLILACEKHDFENQGVDLMYDLQNQISKYL